MRLFAAWTVRARRSNNPAVSAKIAGRRSSRTSSSWGVSVRHRAAASSRASGRRRVDGTGPAEDPLLRQDQPRRVNSVRTAPDAIRVPLKPSRSVSRVFQRPSLQLGVFGADPKTISEMATEDDDARLEARSHVSEKITGAVTVSFSVGERGKQDHAVADFPVHPSGKSSFRVGVNHGHRVAESDPGRGARAPGCRRS